MRQPHLNDSIHIGKPILQLHIMKRRSCRAPKQIYGHVQVSCLAYAETNGENFR